MSLLDRVRVEILAGRVHREERIATIRANAMKALDEASKDEVLLYRQLRCDVEGTHEFADNVIEDQSPSATCCKVCGWLTHKDQE